VSIGHRTARFGCEVLSLVHVQRLYRQWLGIIRRAGHDRIFPPF
jgi:hypothetical protein